MEKLAQTKDFCPNAACPDYGKVQAEQSKANLKKIGKTPRGVQRYRGRGRPPTQAKPGKDWLYLQIVKHRDEHGRLQNVERKAIWGSKADLIELLGKSTAYRKAVDVAVHRELS